MKESDVLNSYFQDTQISGMNSDEFHTVMIGLIEKGLMEMSEINGIKIYRPTLLLKKIKTHFNSDPKTQS